jgi:hypothetical protein
LSVGAVAAEPILIAAHAASTERATELFLVASRYLRQPERGPPDLG